MPYCPNCGREVEETDRFCIECGEELGDRTGRHRHDGEDVPWDSEPGLTPGLAGRKTAELSGGILWGPIVVVIIGVLQSAYFILAPGDVLTAAGFGEEITESVIIATGVLGLLMCTAVLGLVYYYWTRGHVDKRYFYGLAGLGVAGFFLGGGLAFSVLVLVGGYGYFSKL